jgi:HSP20 family protein
MLPQNTQSASCCAPASTGAAKTKSVLRRSPTTDIHESGDAIVLTLDVPGVAPNDVSLSVEGEVLSISAEQKAVDLSPRVLRHVEQRPATFSRSFQLPDNVRRDGIDAKLVNGVLTVTLPKAEETKLRKIPVRGA